MLPPKEQLEIICKGADTVVSREELLRKLEKAVAEDRPLTVKLGLDPSAPDIHLGHAVVLRKVRQLQDLGHRAVIVIGDFTGRIGDPTGKAKGRAALSDQQVRENAETYCAQIFRVIDQAKTEVRFNSQWLAKLDFEAVLRLASATTVARLLERDDFQSRYRSQTPIGLHEFFYPLMQAYDSVELGADIELGGTDQTFNVLMGRTLQKSLGQPPQIALFMPLLVGLDGVEKMSKSLGNYIGVSEPAQVMFKKVMELPDRLIPTYYALATDEHPRVVDQAARELAEGRNPRDVKYALAETITGLYHSAAETRRAADYYDAAFTRKAVPEDIPDLALPRPQATLRELTPQLIAAGRLASGSALTRLLRQGGVQLDGKKADLAALDAPLSAGMVLKLGKKTFYRLTEAQPNTSSM